MQFGLDICNYYPSNHYKLLHLPQMHASLIKEIDHLFHVEPISVLGCGLYRQDFESLHDCQWLRSEAIAFLTAILQQDYNQLFSYQTPPTQSAYFMTHQVQLMNKPGQLMNKPGQLMNLMPCKILNPSVSSMLLLMGSHQYILESMQGQNLFGYRYLLMPTNTETRETGRGSHWFLMIYDTVLHKMWTMDSAYGCVHANAKLMGERLCQMRRMFKVEQKNRRVCQLILAKQETNEQLRKTADWIMQHREFSVAPVEDTIKQKNNYDCGVHAVGNIQQFLRLLQNSIQVDFHHLNMLEQVSRHSIDPAHAVGDGEFFRDLRIRYYSKAFEILSSAQSPAN